MVFTSTLSRYLYCWLYVLISLLSTLCSFVVEFMLQGLYVLVSLLCCLCVLMYLSLKSCSSTFHMLNLCSRIIDVVSSALIFSFMFFSFIIGFTFWFLYCLLYGLVSLHWLQVRGGFRAAAASKMERFVIIVNRFQPITIITKHSILNVAGILDPPL